MRSVFNLPVEWSDDVARAYGRLELLRRRHALARGENAGVTFSGRSRAVGDASHRPDAFAALLTLIITAYVAYHALNSALRPDTPARPLPLELTFYPMGAGAACLNGRSPRPVRASRLGDIAIAVAIIAGLVALWLAETRCRPARCRIRAADAHRFRPSLGGGMAIVLRRSRPRLI